MLPAKRLWWHVSAGCCSCFCAVVKQLSCLSGNFWLRVLITATEHQAALAGLLTEPLWRAQRLSPILEGWQCLCWTLQASPLGLWRLPRTWGDSSCYLLLMGVKCTELRLLQCQCKPWGLILGCLERAARAGQIPGARWASLFSAGFSCGSKCFKIPILWFINNKEVYKQIDILLETTNEPFWVS